MKIAKSISAFCMISFVCCAMGLASEETIGWLFKDKINDKVPVKVYIKDIVNQTGQGQITSEAFKKELEASLHERRSIRFIVVNNVSESDIQMIANIKDFKYMEKGIFKPTPGIATTLLDAVATMTENYVEMTVEYTVIDTKSDKMLWNHTINEYIKKRMTEEECIPLIYDAVTRTFVWKCFGKANLRESDRHNAM
jgi:hypothetical protein